ncbi:unnamed protein product, partial [marine sediment metagenome]
WLEYPHSTGGSGYLLREPGEAFVHCLAGGVDVLSGPFNYFCWLGWSWSR